MRQSWSGRPEHENMIQMKADLKNRDDRCRLLVAQSEHDFSSFVRVFSSQFSVWLSRGNGC